MTFEQKRRAAFEEWYISRFLFPPVAGNDQFTEHAHYCYEAWKAALKWESEVGDE